MEVLPKNDNPLPLAPTRYEGTTRPPLVIKPSVDHVGIPFYASRIRSMDYAQAFLGATIVLANYKEVCTSLEDAMYRQRWPYSFK
ncbi:hypothetical protein D8674_017974 [Pyrus ussuriensis x Pyrus communis]|uniref:Uncharacterized protein n=1 Tax=Pyrus ussuriensis x Pyrus communis TaxID=2448454 RepID=A0A5N5HSG5_9ROSA|nr:hypothetical protein D8674_017974 [Pyrus ussuriensis x Pyrus communis]